MYDLGKDFVLQDDGNGVYIKEWYRPEPEPCVEELQTMLSMQAIRQKRNQLLQETDFTQIPDCPLTPEQKEAYRIYRQALRDLPENIDINNPLFPDKPE